MIFCKNVTWPNIHARRISKLDFFCKNPRWPPFFVKNKGKILKIHGFWRKKQNFQAQMLFFMPFIWSLIFLKQTCFSKISKKQDGRHISVQKCKYKGKCYKK